MTGSIRPRSRTGAPASALSGLAVACLGLLHDARAQDVDALFAAADGAVERGAWRDALDPLVRLEKLLVVEEDLSDLAARIDQVAEQLQQRAAFADSLLAHEAALRLRKRLIPRGDDPTIAHSLNGIAVCLESLGRYAEALLQHEAVLAMVKRMVGDDDHAGVASALENVAHCLQALGRFPEALVRYEEALAMLQRLVGKNDHRDVAALVRKIAVCLLSLGRPAEALPRLVESLAMTRRLVGGRDDGDTALGLDDLGTCLRDLGRLSEALQACEEGLAMQKRLLEGRDHPQLATSLNNVGLCLSSMARFSEAQAHYEAALAMTRRLFPDGDHPRTATALHNVALGLKSMGRPDEALPLYEQALGIMQRSAGGGDHPGVATTLCALASCLESAGRWSEALPRFEAAFAMRRRIFGDVDHPQLAASWNNIAGCQRALGRLSDALVSCEAALAMQRRLANGRDHPDLAASEHNVGECLRDLGRSNDALPYLERSVAILLRVFGLSDHPSVASGLADLGRCLEDVGRATEALPRFEVALAMHRRLRGDGDHRDVAASLNALAKCLDVLGRSKEALPIFEAALAMRLRLFGERDHSEVATSCNNLAYCLDTLGRSAEALPLYERALAMWRRVHGDRDHGDIVCALSNVASFLRSLRRDDAAMPLVQEACDRIERLRAANRLSPSLQQSHFDTIKAQTSAFDWLQAMAVKTDFAVAFAGAERSRCRELLDMFERQHADPLEEAVARANRRGDTEGVNVLRRLQTNLASTALEGDRLLHGLTVLQDAEMSAADREAKRSAIQERALAVDHQRRQLLDERARLLADVLPVARVRTAAEVVSCLREGEVFLEFTILSEVAIVYVMSHDGAKNAVVLSDASAAVLAWSSIGSGARLAGALRGRDPETDGSAAAAIQAARRAFVALMPPSVWNRVRDAKRVFVAAHGALHRLPFEALVTDVRDEQPVYWIDSGPPISYVPSGSALFWLRNRARASQNATIDALVVGDPKLGAAKESPDSAADLSRFSHHDDLKRLSRLPALKGARAEAEAVAAAFRRKDGKPELLIDAHAAEPAVAALAGEARYVHFACHGIAEEHANQSLSMLVLAQPKEVQANADGFLKLTDLIESWSGRLARSELVVLSACRTSVGPTFRDDAPQALPFGFLFAGAPAVISSLWSVDDDSTRVLMTDFYDRLLAGEADELRAFNEAKKALRKNPKYGDPFYWAPFQFLGDPE